MYGLFFIVAQNVLFFCLIILFGSPRWGPQSDKNRSTSPLGACRKRRLT